MAGRNSPAVAVPALVGVAVDNSFVIGSPIADEVVDVAQLFHQVLLLSPWRLDT